MGRREEEVIDEAIFRQIYPEHWGDVALVKSLFGLEFILRVAEYPQPWDKSVIYPPYTF